KPVAEPLQLHLRPGGGGVAEGPLRDPLHRTAAAQRQSQRQGEREGRHGPHGTSLVICRATSATAAATASGRSSWIMCRQSGSSTCRPYGLRAASPAWHPAQRRASLGSGTSPSAVSTTSGTSGKGRLVRSSARSAAI